MSDESKGQPVLGDRGRGILAKAFDVSRKAASWSKAQYDTYQERRKAEKEAKARQEAHSRHRAVLDELEYLRDYLEPEIWGQIEPALEAVGPNEGYETAKAIATDETILDALDEARAAKRAADWRRELAETKAFFDNPLNTYRVDLEPFFKALGGNVAHAAMRQVLTETNRIQTTATGAIAQAGKSYFEGSVSALIGYGANCNIERTLEDMRSDERAILRLTYILELYGVRDNWPGIRVNLAWGNGAARMTRKNSGEKLSKAQGVAMQACERLLQQANAREAVDSVRSILNSLMQDPDTNDALREEIRAALWRGANWLTREETPGTIYDGGGDDALILGRMPDGEPLTFQGDGSLLTVAPPGAGKTQAQVLPNLLNYRGPVVVLDVKGECYEHTAEWREKNVGPVYRFAPEDPASSARFNPLDFVRADPNFLVRDARDLASLMMPSGNTNDPYWRDAAKDVISAKIAYLVARGDANATTMSDLIDLLTPTAEDWKAIEEFCANHEARSVQRLGRQILNIPEKTRDNIYSQARTSLSAWEGDDIEALASSSDWSPEDFCRRDFNGTLYICVNPTSVDVLSSVLRVLIGMHVNHLIELSERGRDDLPVLFMVDELPVLGNMPPLLKGIEVGRSKGVKVWGFCQTLQQIAERYGKEDRFTSVTKVVSYMNPEPGLARRLAGELGEREGLLDGKRKSLAEPSELAGPEWADDILVTASGMRPARVHKWPLYQPDHPFHGRASWPSSSSD